MIKSGPLIDRFLYDFGENEMKKDLVWLNAGGMGNIVMRTSLMKELKERYNEIYAICPYFDIFEIQDIEGAFPNAPNSLYSQLIKDNDDVEVIAENPYNNSDFIKKKIHFNDALRDLFGIPRIGTEACMNELPNLPVAEKHKEVAEDVQRFLNQCKKHKFILIQNTGGQSSLDPNAQPVGASPLIRNYKFMPELASLLKTKYPNYEIIQYKLPQETKLEATDESPEKPYLWYRILGEELAKDKDNFAITIDSSLQHLLAGTGLNTTVLWFETQPQHFGHSCHHNIQGCKNDLTHEQPYFQAWQNTPAVVRYKKPEEIFEEIKGWLPKAKKE